MPLGRPNVALILTDDERVRLDSVAHRSRTAPCLAQHPDHSRVRRGPGQHRRRETAAHVANHCV